MNLNRVMIAGNCTKDSELRYTNSKQAVTTFGVAINRRWKDKDGQAKEEVTFVDVEFWGKSAESAAQWLKKGTGVYVEGRLRVDSWEKDGQKRSKMMVVGDSWQFTSSKPKDDEGDTI